MQLLAKLGYRRFARAGIKKYLLVGLSLCMTASLMLFNLSANIPRRAMYKQGGFQPLPLFQTPEQVIVDKPSVLMLIRDAQNRKIGSMKLAKDSAGKPVQILFANYQVPEGAQMKYLGVINKSEKEMFAVVGGPGPSKMTIVSIDAAGHISELSAYPLQSPTRNLEVLFVAHDHIVLAMVEEANQSVVHLLKVDSQGMIACESSHGSRYGLSKVLLPLGKNAVVSVKKDELIIHEFQSDGGKRDSLFEKRIAVPGLKLATLGASVHVHKDTALLLHDEAKRTMQIVWVNENPQVAVRIENLESDEKWDAVIAVPESREVALIQKKSALNEDRINLLKCDSNQRWKLENTLSTKRDLEVLGVLSSKVLRESNFLPLGHPQNPIKALHVTLEYFQSEVGGIAAVTKTLVPKLNENTTAAIVEASAIMPKFSFLKYSQPLKKIAMIEHFYQKRWVKSAIYQAAKDLLLVEPLDDETKGMYQVSDKNGLYSEDEPFAPIQKWLYFNSAVAAFASSFKDPETQQPFHILHMHSYHASIVSELLDIYQQSAKSAGFRMPKTVLHMHGLGYDQGWIKGRLLQEIGLNSHSEWENLTKRTLDSVDFVITVSQNMLNEGLSDKQSLSFGLKDYFQKLKDKNQVFAVLNGINAAQWNPSDDKILPPYENISQTFDENNVETGKKRLKTYLKNIGRFSEDNRPLVTFVGRFSDEKGIEHLIPAAAEIVRAGGNLAVMGSYGKSLNSREMLNKLKAMALEKPYLGRVLIIDTVEEQLKGSLGNYIRAASDFSFVPSREETCGLVPLEFFGFGALSITSFVGGLKDTIIPFEPNISFFNGFKFNYADTDDLYWTINEAFKVMKESPGKFAAVRREIMKRAPQSDWSTPGGAVSQIISIYESAVSQWH